MILEIIQTLAKLRWQGRTHMCPAKQCLHWQHSNQSDLKPDRSQNVSCTSTTPPQVYYHIINQAHGMNWTLNVFLQEVSCTYFWIQSSCLWKHFLLIPPTGLSDLLLWGRGIISNHSLFLYLFHNNPPRSYCKILMWWPGVNPVGRLCTTEMVFTLVLHLRELPAKCQVCYIVPVVIGVSHKPFWRLPRNAAVRPHCQTVARLNHKTLFPLSTYQLHWH